MVLFENCRPTDKSNKWQRDKVFAVVGLIYDEDYFVDIWSKVNQSQRLEELTVGELLEPFQRFWESLPDRNGILRDPFNLICDLAEAYCDLAHEPGDGPF